MDAAPSHPTWESFFAPARALPTPEAFADETGGCKIAKKEAYLIVYPLGTDTSKDEVVAGQLLLSSSMVKGASFEEAVGNMDTKKLAVAFAFHNSPLTNFLPMDFTLRTRAGEVTFPHREALLMCAKVSTLLRKLGEPASKEMAMVLDTSKRLPNPIDTKTFANNTLKAACSKKGKSFRDELGKSAWNDHAFEVALCALGIILQASQRGELLVYLLKYQKALFVECAEYDPNFGIKKDTLQLWKHVLEHHVDLGTVFGPGSTSQDMDIHGVNYTWLDKDEKVTTQREARHMNALGKGAMLAVKVLRQVAEGSARPMSEASSVLSGLLLPALGEIVPGQDDSVCRSAFSDLFRDLEEMMSK